MSYLEKLRDAKTLKDVARILGEKPQTISFLLYKLRDDKKYRSFEIPKRNGDTRLINAPEPRLKRLQRRLADVLYSCVAEIEKKIEKSAPPPLAHGFARERSIFTNASVHRRRRYVLNLDLQDFFPSFNFGRVRGFFIKDNRFKLNEKVATVIAQIACHEDELPQGSPCSPIISNLLGHLLDVRLVQLAKKNQCSYSRYADDLTFSTNLKDFPVALAEPIRTDPPHWRLSARLESEIRRAGFKINPGKTRMQWRGSRQVTTGLIVNEKVNVKSEYYRKARAICHRLFATGSYYISDTATPVEGLNKIAGILSHIHYIKEAAIKAEFEKREPPKAARELYKKFLFYKHFVALEKPLIVTEGKTDVIYLRAAIKKLTSYYPQLGGFDDGKFSSVVRFINYSSVTCKVLQLAGGTGDIYRLIKTYEDELKSFKVKPFAHPVILLIDNDDGAARIFKVVKEQNEIDILHKDTQPFYHLQANLYLIKTPEKDGALTSCIEDLFDPKWLEFTIREKTFNLSNKNGQDRVYGKAIFANEVVIPNAHKIDFSKFGILLDRIVAVLNDYKKRKPPSAAS